MTKCVFGAADLEPSVAHKFALGLVVPRPIGWIGSRSADGVNNLAPFSFFNAVTGYPPTVMFSPGLRDGLPKDTLSNVTATGVFTVNVVSAELGDKMNRTASTAAPDIDEFELAGLDVVEGCEVAAPMVGAAPANLECRVTQVVWTGRPETRGVVVFGEVAAYHIDESVLDNTYIDQTALDAIGRMGGPTYTHTRSLFSMDRPE